MKTGILILVLFFSINSYCQNSNFNFLCIGSAHYKYKTEGVYRDVPEVIESTLNVADILKKYGTGTTLVSKPNKILTKAEIRNAIQSLIEKSFNDGFSTMVIYYCGHGNADFQGNLYFIPGNFRSFDKHANHNELEEKLLGVNEIQSIYMEELYEWENRENTFDTNYLVNFKKYIKYKSLLDEYIEEHTYQAINSISTEIRKKMPDAAVGESKPKPSLNKLKQYEKIFRKMPKLIILADCCYSKLASDKGFSPDYIAMFEPETKLAKLMYERYKKTGIMPSEETVEAYKDLPYGDEDGNREIPEFAHYLGNNTNRIRFGLAGSKVVYSSEAFKSTQMTYAPYDKTNEVILGPISRRLSIYFKSNPSSFTLYSLIDKLVSKSFDPSTKASYIETPVLDSTFNVLSSHEFSINDQKFLNYKIYKK